ncbi:MAG: hypothetical protein ACKVKF_13190 [Rhodobacterales bacterium]
MSWCGYIDILGTREAAASGLSDVRAHLDDFHSALFDHFDSFQNGQCIAASDGAFFEAEGIDDFYDFYRRVRNTLFERGIFFKCSFVPGRIRFEERQKTKPDGSVAFKSLEFSDQATAAFQVESALKGRGCWVKVKDNLPKNTITNFMVVKASGKFSVEKFEDFAFSKFEVGSDDDIFAPAWPHEARLIDSIFYHCHYSIINSDNFSMKYLPLFVNAVRSSDLRDIRFTSGKWERAPYIVHRLVGSKASLAAISKVPGLRYLLLALYDEYFSQNKGEFEEGAEGQIVRLLTSRNDCTTNLNSVPDFVLKPRARAHLMEEISKSRGIRKTRPRSGA